MAKFNKVTVELIIADFFINSGWGLIAPIFAIFITRQIAGGTIGVVAFATATFWIVKSTIQPFLANVLDNIDGEKDDFKVLIFGSYMAAMIPFLYFFATEVWHIFFLETVRGIAMACVVPAWLGIFTRHITKGWEAFSWSIQSTVFGFASGLAAAFGGIVTSFLGFGVVFIMVGILKMISATLLLAVYYRLFPGEGMLGLQKRKARDS